MYSGRIRFVSLENEPLSELAESRCGSMAWIETTDCEPRARCTKHDDRERIEEKE